MKTLTSNKRKRLLIRSLWILQEGKCYYCNVDTILPERIKNKNHRALPPQTATIEHIYARWDDRRKKMNKIVLACYKCNKTRGDCCSDTYKAVKQQSDKPLTVPMSFFLKK
jgi:hypothetical protein